MAGPAALWSAVLLLLSLVAVQGPTPGAKFWLGNYSFVNRSIAGAGAARRCFDPERRPDQLGFTPARTYPRVGGKVALVLMITTMAHNPHHRVRFLLWGRGLRSRWHTWRIRLLQPSPYVMPIIVFQYHPDLNLSMVAEWLALREVDCAESATAVACRTFAAVDTGYRLFSGVTTARPGGRRFYLLMTQRNLTLAPGYNRTSWYEAPILGNGILMAYVIGTNFYCTDMFEMRVLDYFDFFLKLDDDITFQARLTGDVRAHIRRRASLFLHTGTAQEPEPVIAGLADCVRAFLGNESQRCCRPVAALSAGAEYFEDKALVYYSNFIMGWLGFFASPEVLAFSRFWADWPDGRWEHRWGDQQFWSQALGLFHDGSRIVNLTDWRRTGAFRHRK